MKQKTRSGSRWRIGFNPLQRDHRLNSLAQFSNDEKKTQGKR
jgi:hypothetical protein